MRLSPEAVIVAEIRYHNTDQPQPDQTSLRLALTEDEPPLRMMIDRSPTARSEWQGLQPGPNDGGPPRFLIPAGEAAHTEHAIRELPSLPGHHLEVFSTFGHVHYTGSTFRMWIERADGSEGPCLLYIPRWDFDWQLQYDIDRTAGPGPRIYPGDRLHYACTYDNTADNPNVQRLLEEEGLGATEPHDVYYGPSSTNEMCGAVLGLLAIPDA